MRLKEEKILQIKEVVQQMDSNAKIVLFGSRVFDQKKAEISIC